MPSPRKAPRPAGDRAQATADGFAGASTINLSQLNSLDYRALPDPRQVRR
jgi:hypothetical protein